MKNIKSFSRMILEESGLQNINKLAEKYKKCVIYYHQDMDGVASAISIREYLKSYGIQIVGAEWTQYGPRTFANDIKPWADDTMMVLVDFAQGSPYFVVATDHHDRQTDFDKSLATSTRTSPSNVETLDRIVAKNPAFPQEDLDAISMIDSAGYLKHDVASDEVVKSVLGKATPGRTPGGITKNKVMIANVTNRLLLAYKNKTKKSDRSSKGYLLNKLVLECPASLTAMYQMIKKVADAEGWDSGETITKHHADYVNKQRESKNVKYDSERGIIVQYGGGSMIKTGSYNRYTPFELYPDSIFLSIAWPMGLLQVSCNPFKKKMFPDIDLGKIMRSIVDSQQERLSKVWTNLETIKRVSESELKEDVDAIGYKWDSISTGFLTSFSKDEEVELDGDKINLFISSNNISNPYSQVKSETVKSLLKKNRYSDDITLDSVECYLTNGDRKVKVRIFKDWALDQKINKLVEFSIKNLTGFDLENSLFTIETKESKYRPLSESDSKILEKVQSISNKYHKDLSRDEKEILSKIKVNAYDLIKKSSGGHKAITNMSGFQNLQGCNDSIEEAFGDLFSEKLEAEDSKSKYVQLLKLMQVIFVEELSKMVDIEKETLGTKTYSDDELTPDLTSTISERVVNFNDFIKFKLK